MVLSCYIADCATLINFNLPYLLIRTFPLLTSYVQWGLFSAVAGGVGYAFSPIYRGLTIQFKMYD